jgi:hypothetical protein
MTCPATLAPALVRVKVEALIVDGFIALTNVAVITAVLGQTSVEASVGVTDVTPGDVEDVPGFDGVPTGFVLALHPTRATAEKKAAIQSFRTFDLRISFSSSPVVEFHASKSEAVNILSAELYICLIIDTIRYL